MECVKMLQNSPPAGGEERITARQEHLQATLFFAVLNDRKKKKHKDDIK